ncbi:MAG: PBP1A family penicillin-binding protein [Pseudomonadota bacterium]
MTALLGFATRVAAVAFIAIIAGVGLLGWYGRDLPPVANFAEARKQPRITVLDRRGTEIGVHGQDRGTPVHTDDLPDHVVQAFVATEDRNFYHHVGVNPVAIVRALMVNMRKGGVAQGGSTITQQLVKNLILSPDQTVRRKAQEMLLAVKIEMQLDKDEILSLYLNRVYFGYGAYGLEAASRRYFGKGPKDLTIGEAAMLAGLLKAPSRYSPKANATMARDRAQVVLSAMVDAGFLKASTAEHIKASGIATVIQDDRRLDYAIDYAVAEAERLLGGFDEDVVVHTTLDASLIRQMVAARELIADADPSYTDEVQTAALVLEEDGAIRGLVGGNDYKTSVYNRATQAKRQPGSVFKPFVYLAALENNWYPEDLIDDSPVQIGDYSPTNYRDRYYGEVPLTEAMSRSLNAAVIRLQEDIGRHQVVSAARRAGFPPIQDTGPAMALGVFEATPLEVAESFLPLSNGGYRRTSYVLRQIDSRAGKPLYKYRAPEPGAPVFDADVLNAFDHMMRSVVRSGSGIRAQVAGHYAAGKTGTSQDSRDAWFAGYASGMVGVVWLGKDDDTPMGKGRKSMSGSGSPARLWSAMMTAALADRPARLPTPYIPKPRAKTLFDHLSQILGRSSNHTEQSGRQIENQPNAAARDADDLTQLLEEMTL